MEPDLNLPRFESEPLPPSLRTLEEINDWIEEDYQYFFNRKVYEEEKRKCSVDIPFTLY